MKKEVQSTFTDLLQTIVNAGFMEDDHTVDRNKFTQIVNDRNFNRVKALYDDAIEKGAKTAFGGVFDAHDRTISPTVLTNVTPDMKIMQEEIFAPILPIMNYEDISEAVDYITERDKPLALYVFSHNQELIDYVPQRYDIRQCFCQ